MNPTREADFIPTLPVTGTFSKGCMMHCILLLSRCKSAAGYTRIVLCCVCIVLYCIVLYCIALHCIVLYCITLHCIAFHCIALHRIIYRIMSFHAKSCNYMYIYCLSVDFNVQRCDDYQMYNAAFNLQYKKKKTRRSVIPGLIFYFFLIELSCMDQNPDWCSHLPSAQYCYTENVTCCATCAKLYTGNTGKYKC